MTCKNQEFVSKRADQFAKKGFLLHKALVAPDECDLLATELTSLFVRQQKESKSKLAGVRNLLGSSKCVRSFSKSVQMLSILEEVVGKGMFPVRAIFFDKNPNANWLVPWHRDLAIALSEQRETPGFTGWSIKAGACHVHPPREILEGMATVRLHLDDCIANNGALKVIPGSHLYGKIEASHVSRWTNNCQHEVCEASKGDVLLMRPLLLHASSPAENPTHRRILHVEFAAQQLPNGLQWLES